MRFLNLAFTALISSIVIEAHPGHDVKCELQERAKALENTKRDISHCSAQLKARGIEKRTIERRSNILRAEREKRGLSTARSLIKTRDSTSVLNTTHLSSVHHVPYDPVDTIFAGNQSCILVPEVTEGPYYVTGEYIRQDVREDYHQNGVDLVVDIQVIDTSTCEPVPDLYIDFWHANASGVYSGVVVSGNGAGTADPTNINATFGRGLQPTDDEGVAEFITYYPGHYTGRTQHIHVATHYNGTVLANGTFSGSVISHVGQIFFDSSLSDQVENTTYYENNTQPITTNAEDSIFIQEAAAGDPIVEYSLLGSDVADGIFAWIAFGIDVSAQKSISAAASYGSGGGVASSNSGFPGGNGTGPGGNGTLPSGVPPSASATAV